MLVVLKSQRNADKFLSELIECRIDFEVKSVDKYTDCNITPVMVDVKEALDRATLQEASLFREKIGEIPAALQS